MAHLRYDNRDLTGDAIGVHGVSTEDRDALSPRLEQARDAVRAARERGELGFLDCPDIDVDPFVDYAAEVRERGFTDQVVIGVGGSSLGARAVYESAAGNLDGLRTHFAENVDPEGFGRLLDAIDPRTTLFVVVTKSGSTIETMSKFWAAYDLVIDAVDDATVSDHFLAITDPERGGLRGLTAELGFDSFEVPPNVGGRFSVLTAVGLAPLAIAGYPVADLQAGARRARETALDADVETNPLLQAAADQFLLYQAGTTMSVMMAYSDHLGGLVEWFCQLWAESLGKRKNRRGEDVHVGMTPIRALGAVDQHSQVQLYMEGPRDKNIIFLQVERFRTEVSIPDRRGLPDSLAHLAGRDLSELMHAEFAGTRLALREARRPTSRWIFSSITADAVGGFILSWEFITAIVGELLDIDAFNQPGVELGKKIAHGLLGRDGFEEYAGRAREREEGETQGFDVV